MPSARKVVTRSPKRNVGLVNCPWFQDHPIEHESRLEKHFVLRSILFPGLKTIQHQPFKMALELNGKQYTPDFLLTFSNGDGLVIEVKRAERVKELKERFNEIAGTCNQNKLQFFVVHQGQIEDQRRAARATLIRRYAMHSCDPSAARQVTDYVTQHQRGVSIGNVKKKLHVSQEQVLGLVARRSVVLDKALLISEDGLLFPPNLEIKNASIQFGSWFGCTPWNPAAGVPSNAGRQQDSVRGSENAARAGDQVVRVLRGNRVEENSSSAW